MNSFVSHSSPPLSAGINEMSLAELRLGIHEFLRSSGALGSLKTQLRGVITSELLKRRRTKDITAGECNSRELDAGADVSNKDGEGESAWMQRLADAIVEQHLRQTGRAFSLAIFSSEADVSFRATGDDALAVLLHLDNPVLTTAGWRAGPDSTPANAKVAHHRSSSFLQILTAAHLRHVGDSRGQRPGYAVGTQTDSDFGSEFSGESAKPPVEVRLAAVDAKYALCFARMEHSTREELDRRMETYREELKLQMEQTYQQRLRAFEQQKLLEVRREAEEHFRLLLQHKMEEQREIERLSAQRVEAERVRLSQAREDIQLQRVELERRQREIQLLLDERDKATVEMEGRLHDAKQQIRVLTSQLQQFEELCASRLAEAEAARDREMRRVGDIRRLQAEHVAELQLKDEEICRLRFRLKSLAASNTGGSWHHNALNTTENGVIMVHEVPSGATRQHKQGSRQQASHEATYLTSTPVPREAAWQSIWHSTDVVGPTEVVTAPWRGEEGVVERRSHLVDPSLHSSDVHRQGKRGSRDTNDAAIESQERSMNIQPRRAATTESGSTVTTTSSRVGSRVLLADAAVAKSAHESATAEKQETPVPQECGSSERSGRAGNDEKDEVAHSKSSSGSTKVTRSNTTGEINGEVDRSHPPVVQGSHSEGPLSLNASEGNTAIASSSKMSSVRSHKSQSATTPRAAASHALSDLVGRINAEEEDKRKEIEKEEETNRGGIKWAATSQHNLLVQRQTAMEEFSGREESNVVLLDRTTISDDGSEDDILYRKGDDSDDSI
ncbi:hypothetical protein, conserved [Trypanosoma brucei gambiense DAL972]|uniref:LisH domain-containing protein n=1 Tax=Trypanosoma brucei gambiense (strain MHOM/CI/86/DAL972) TaxID=679716 RepID=D0A1Z7_TRYB9|nr:hypothetical protein, conserved [Trypanosoma brucei gambiense DAL972]CBH15290.1 hypothetical protein, conserved [Trypanosoma brucei gambiense DAL972]|eukprot:XP_011777555.1 hypothetical protein, conserved [Trypanosoma brucei gambiense DAL972]